MTTRPPDPDHNVSTFPTQINMKILALCLALLLAMPAQAETKAPTKALPLSGLFSGLLKKIQDVTLADLKAASALATAHGNQLGAQCWQAWIAYLEEEQQASTGPDGKPVVLPQIHLLYDAEKVYDLLQALQPTSKLSISCAAFKNSATSVTIPLPLP